MVLFTMVLRNSDSTHQLRLENCGHEMSSSLRLKTQSLGNNLHLQLTADRCVRQIRRVLLYVFVSTRLARSWLDA